MSNIKVRSSGTSESFNYEENKSKVTTLANFVDTLAQTLRAHAKKKSVTEMTQREVKQTDQPLS